MHSKFGAKYHARPSEAFDVIVRASRTGDATVLADAACRLAAECPEAARVALPFVRAAVDAGALDAGALVTLRRALLCAGPHLRAELARGLA